MNYQDSELQAEYERGKHQAEEIWAEFLHNPDSMSGVIQSHRTHLAMYLRIAGDTSCSPGYRRDAEKQASHCQGWLDAWG
jgi:hypothetical protein